jgi:hypothetical protein
LIMRQRRREATANDSNSPKVHRFESFFATVQIKPVIIVLPRCKSAEYLQRATSSAADNGLGVTIMYLRRTGSCTAGSDLGAAIKYLWRSTSGAAGNGLGAMIKYLRGAASIDLGTTIKYLRRTTRQRPGHHDEVTATNNEWRRGQRPGHHDQVPGAHNERHRGKKSPRGLGSQCVCVEPGLSRYVHGCAV